MIATTEISNYDLTQKMLVVRDGSLNDRIAHVVGFVFWTVELAHLSISWSVIGRPSPNPERPMSVLVMLSLSKATLSTQRLRRGKGNTPHQ